MLKYEKIVVGEMAINCYLVWSENKETVVVDPGDEGVEVAQRINDLGLTPTAIWLTHGHFDHLMGIADLKLIYNIPVFMDKKDNFLLMRAGKTAGYFLNGGDKPPMGMIEEIVTSEPENLCLGEEKVRVIPLPGHTPGGIGYFLPKTGWLFAGDTIFEDGGVGRSDLGYADKKQLEQSIGKILKLGDEVLVLPGHGETFYLGDWRKFRQI